MRLLAIILVASAITLPTMVQSKMLSNDDEIRQMLVGNTISGEEEGETYVEFLHPDGRITGEDRQGRYAGHWQLSGGRMCLSYDQEDGEPSNWDCSQVGFEGSRVLWSARGEKSFSNLITGNPNGF
jgi:hypothetical protein